MKREPEKAFIAFVYLAFSLFGMYCSISWLLPSLPVWLACIFSICLFLLLGLWMRRGKRAQVGTSKITPAEEAVVQAVLEKVKEARPWLFNR